MKHLGVTLEEEKEMSSEEMGRVILALVVDEFPAGEDDGLCREDILMGLHWAMLLYARAIRQVELSEGGDPDDLDIDFGISCMIEQHRDEMNAGAVLQNV